MELADYQESISLFEPWEPCGPAVDLDDVIEQIQKDSALVPYLQDMPLPAQQERRREWLRAMLTVRPAEHNSALYNAVDGLLYAEHQNRQIQRASNLKTDLPLERAGSHLSLWQGDITCLKIDAIVNAANADLQGCFRPFHACIDNAIHNVSGARLRQDCHTIIQRQGHSENTGNAKITRGYNLPSRFVLHTVGPIIFRSASITKDDKSALADCYRACLSLAAETGVIDSVAFCGISTGVFGFPKEDASKIAVKTVIHWLNQNPGKIKHVVFNTFDEESTTFYREALRAWM